MQILCCIVTFPTKGDGRLFFRHRLYVGRYIGIYVCEQLPGANSSPIVTKLLVIPLATGILEGQGRWGGMRSTERPSSLICVSGTRFCLMASVQHQYDRRLSVRMEVFLSVSVTMQQSGDGTAWHRDKRHFTSLILFIFLYRVSHNFCIFMLLRVAEDCFVKANNARFCQVKCINQQLVSVVHQHITILLSC